MAVTYRAVKGAGLTDNEIDENFRSVSWKKAATNLSGGGTFSVTTNANYYHVDTGSTYTAIANLPDSDSSNTFGQLVRLQFEGATTLTHNGTSFILPGAANITTAAGDVATFIQEAANNWRCVDYMNASQVPKRTHSFSFISVSAVGSNTSYARNGNSAAAPTTETEAQILAGVAGTVKNLRVKLPAGTTDGNTVFTMRKNATSDQTVTVTVAGGATDTESDTTNSFSVTATDTISIKIDNTASTTATGRVAIFYQIEE
jgi:hypothetical protein